MQSRLKRLLYKKITTTKNYDLIVLLVAFFRVMFIKQAVIYILFMNK